MTLTFHVRGDCYVHMYLLVSVHVIKLFVGTGCIVLDFLSSHVEVKRLNV